MAIQVTIDAGSKGDAQRIAEALPGAPEARSWRGYGIIRLRFRRETDARGVLPVVQSCVETHALAWARVRIGDDEQMFRAKRRAS